MYTSLRTDWLLAVLQDPNGVRRDENSYTRERLDDGETNGEADGMHGTAEN